MRDPRVAKTEIELRRIFNEQVLMLADRCDAYYEGKHYEASSVASIVHNFVYDHGKKSQSLLGQLGMKSALTFLDSRSRNRLTIASMRGIWPITPTPHAQYTNDNRYSFDEWWEKQEFNVKFSDISFTRAELIGAVRNQEGGGHIAPYSHEKIAIIQRSPSRWKSIREHNDVEPEVSPNPVDGVGWSGGVP